MAAACHPERPHFPTTRPLHWHQANGPPAMATVTDAAGAASCLPRCPRAAPNSTNSSIAVRGCRILLRIIICHACSKTPISRHDRNAVDAVERQYVQ